MAFKGRCFGCHKRGHAKAQCHVQKRGKPNLSLQGLPVEVIELICNFLMDDFVVPWAFRLYQLRLTCRALNQKTLNIFAAAAFRRRIVTVDSAGLQRLLNVANSPVMARQVESLFLVENSQVSHQEYENAEMKMLSQDLSREERENAGIVVLRAYKVLDDKDYMQRLVCVQTTCPYAHCSQIWT
ncbi:hypothetical protein PRZ48_006454 [Zasmidium cellare]|uniref:CCHC-type domain-containing protein n=1 Tax=Zasmidium cellare TaxID=395010 RepID=A0ABR0EN53_ZASCE|nr:hypothetical protein PRZ48_006454 [Zasmidium cellare]